MGTRLNPNKRPGKEIRDKKAKCPTKGFTQYRKQIKTESKAGHTMKTGGDRMSSGHETEEIGEAKANEARRLVKHGDDNNDKRVVHRYRYS